jgi:hypothetical protein
MGSVIRAGDADDGPLGDISVAGLSFRIGFGVSIALRTRKEVAGVIQTGQAE